jgi:hypothetical protein
LRFSVKDHVKVVAACRCHLTNATFLRQQKITEENQNHCSFSTGYVLCSAAWGTAPLVIKYDCLCPVLSLASLQNGQMKARIEGANTPMLSAQILALTPANADMDDLEVRQLDKDRCIQQTTVELQTTCYLFVQ